ncbi:MAG: trimeric intracellular cation channel family protein [Burkholderiales bacterium]|nr:trimeric intracellular cation channel family protein [Burkholderiales bacterium]
MNLQGGISYVLMSFMIIGVVATSISGALRAIESKMDITGAILLAFIASNAGGTVRDIILNSPIFWMEDQFYIWITLVIGALTFILVYYNRKLLSNQRLHTLLIVTDAMGLAAFCLAGVEKTTTYGQNDLIAVLMGVWTAVGGGICADIIANRVPLVFSSEFYLTVAFAGAICYLFLNPYLGNILAGMVATIIMVLFRLYSVKFKWKLPTI